MSIKFYTETVKRFIIPQISKVSLICTYKCNHKCVSCNIWERYKDKPELANQEIKPYEIHEIVSKNKLIAISLTGGEIFLRNDIEVIISICAMHIPLVNIVTNGSKTEYIEQVMEIVTRQYPNNKFIINVSLEGDIELHDGFTKISGSWYRATETIEKLTNMSRYRKNLTVTCEHLVSPSTKDGDEYVKNYAKKLGIEVTYTIEQTAKYYNHNGKQITLNKREFPMPELKASITSIANTLYMGGAKYLNVNRKNCVAGQYSCFIDPYGNIVPCVHYIDVANTGNVRNNGYKINTDGYKEIINGCHGCWTPCETYTTLMFRPWKVLV